MCQPQYSHLLKREFNQHPQLFNDKQKWQESYRYSDLEKSINIESLTDKHTVYLAGGEPTVMKETYSFMRNCIDAGNTNFQLTLGTNANFISDAFL